MARSRRSRRDKWTEALALTPAEWEADDVRQRLLDVALDLTRPWPDRDLAATAANELEFWRGRAEPRR